MLVWKCAKEEGESQAAVGVSAECLRGDIGRSLVVADHPRHDAAGVPELQAIPGVLRRNRDEYIGRPPAEADSSWNHHHQTRPCGRSKADLPAHGERNRSCAGPYGNGPLGGRARRYRQPSACPANTKGQRKISGCNTATLGRKELSGRKQLSAKLKPSPDTRRDDPAFRRTPRASNRNRLRRSEVTPTAAPL